MDTKDSPADQQSARAPTRDFDAVVVGFVAVLLCSNLIGPGKTVSIHPFGAWTLVFGAGNIFFPVSYIFGDVLTEVYGYARARRAIWIGFSALLFASAMSAIILALPPNPAEPHNAKLQPALELVFGSTWRIVLASLLAFWVGDFVNAYVLAKMKVWTQGRHLWSRTIGSTVVGQLCDSALFYPLAFGGVWTSTTMLEVITFNWIFKTSIEVVCTPLTYVVVGWLKRRENMDPFDTDTNFSPFRVE